MERYSYLLLTVFFVGLPLVVVLQRHGKRLFAKHKGFLLFAIMFGGVGFAIVDPLATSWGAWGYDMHKTLGIVTAGGGVIEEFIWALLVAFLLAAVVVIFAEKEGKKKPFWPFF